MFPYLMVMYVRLMVCRYSSAPAWDVVRIFARRGVLRPLLSGGVPYWIYPRYMRY
jgi:hypothetical protein